MLDGKARALPRILPIIREEAKRNGYTLDQLISDDRTTHITAVRQYAMWRARTETGRSFQEIARLFSRDRTTVTHGYWRVENKPEELRGVIPPRLAKFKRAPPEDYGAKYFIKPCRNGHHSGRYVSTGQCVQCKSERGKRYESRRKATASHPQGEPAHAARSGAQDGRHQGSDLPVGNGRQDAVTVQHCTMGGSARG